VVTDLVELKVGVGGRTLSLLMPPDSEALLDEHAFAHEMFLPYWAELWPSGLALAEALEAARPTGSVLELGCGLGLPSLVAALGGARVLATDWAPDAIALLARNAVRNHAALDVSRWSWAQDPALLDGPFDLVIAADVLYEHRNGPQLLAVLPSLAGEVWIADPGRPAAPEFFTAASTTWEVDEIAPRVQRLLTRSQETPEEVRTPG